MASVRRRSGRITSYNVCYTKLLRHQLQLLALLDELAAEGLTIWLSLHDVNLAVRHAERVLCLQGGRLLAQGGVATVDEDLIQALYGVRTERLLHGGRPLFVSR